MYYNNQYNRYPNGTRKKERGYTEKFARQLGIVLIVFLCMLLLKFVSNEVTQQMNAKLKEFFYSDYTEEATEVFKSTIGNNIDLFRDENGANNEKFYIEFLPVQGEITGNFGETFTNSLSQEEEVHKGVEITMEMGQEVKNIFDGEIEAIKADVSGKITIVVNHKNDFKSSYSYFGETTLSKGDHVKIGQVLGACISEEDSQRNILYFELQKNDIPVNPIDHLETFSK